MHRSLKGKINDEQYQVICIYVLII